MKRRILFGLSFESFDTLTEPQAFALRQIADVVRPTINWAAVAPVQDSARWDWKKVDADIAAARAAGLLVCPTICYAPPWAADGKPTYLPYTDGCARWKKDAKTVFDIEFDTSKDYCINPPHIFTGTREDEAAAYQFGAELSRRHGRSLFAYAIWNEPGGDLYWPPIRSESNENDAVHRLIAEVVAPMTNGIRAFDRKAQFVGPEAEGSDILRRCLERERELDLHLYDALTVHPYPPNKSDWTSVFNLIADFRLMMATERDARPVWYSECGQMDMLAFTRRVVAEGHDVSLVSAGDFGQFFEAGTWAGEPKLNDRGREWRELQREVTGGRKARLHI